MNSISILTTGAEHSNSIVTLEKELAITQKALEKAEKSASELLRERDTLHKELKRTESTSISFR